MLEGYVDVAVGAAGLGAIGGIIGVILAALISRADVYLRSSCKFSGVCSHSFCEAVPPKYILK